VIAGSNDRPAGNDALEPVSASPRARSKRFIAHLTGESGPRVIVVAGMHGNEPAGVAAVRAVVDKIERSGAQLSGELAALRGNVRALSEQRRYLAEDLNRLWTEERVHALRAGHAVIRTPEQEEQAELLLDLDELILNAPGEVVVVDMHSTSGPGAPFACISDTLRSRSIALSLPLPLVLGIEEAIHGTLLEHLEIEGVSMVLLEGGMHDAPDTATNLESALWLILRAVGLLDQADLPDLQRHRERLREAVRGLPRVVEVTHRHHVDEGSDFRMRNGLSHFAPVRQGQVLADDDRGPVRAPAHGLLIMPRYQVQGSDGFFIGRPVRRSWLDVSRWARAVRLDRLLPRLPGVLHDPLRPQRLLVDPAVARWFTVQLFHLTGYRRLPDHDGRLVFTRRIEPGG
jgi:hypothetical protein